MAFLSPIRADWIEEFVIAPFNEGTERLNKAFQGVDLDSLKMAPLSWKERAVFLVQGIFLTFFPLFNTLVWIFMKTFGSEDETHPSLESAHLGSPARSPRDPHL